MAGKGAPKGNDYAAKGRMFEDAITRAIKQDDGRRIRQGAEVLLDKFAEGERWAMELVRDTMDGKPKQQIQMSSDPENPFTMIVSEANALRNKMRE